MKSFKEFLIELSLGKAGVFAAVAHTGQHRKQSGAPYIIHPTAVVRILQRLGVKDKNILVAAFLHDTLEDSPTTYNDLKSEFNQEVADLVKEVTSVKKKLELVGKPAYLAFKMIKSSDAGLMIKLADRVSNMSDIDIMPIKTSEKLINQTDYIIQELVEKRKLNKYHKKLIKIINRIIIKWKKKII